MFEPGLVELAVDLDRLAPQKDAAAERLREMEPVPAVQYAPPAGGEHDRHDRHAGKPRDVDDAAAGPRRRTARPVGSDTHPIPCHHLPHPPPPAPLPPPP